MAFNKTKVDPELGVEVQKHLEQLGINTPTIPNTLDRKEQIEVIEGHFSKIMETLGLDLRDDSLMDTPKRVAKMFVNEIFYGLSAEAFPKVTTIDNTMNSGHMVVERNIKVYSDCEHHFRTIFGNATVAYIPSKKVIGLSKMNRIVDYFARRPQVQERLTEQIHAALCYVLQTEDVAVVLDCKHMCVSQRGIEDTGSSTVTSKLGGSFMTDQIVRSEFMTLAHKL